MGAWPMPDMQKQVDSVREAFSADVRKPFVLKPSFPYGSPTSSAHSSPPAAAYRQDLGRNGLTNQQAESQVQHSQVSYINYPITPVSASGLDSHSDSPGLQQPLSMMTSGPSQTSSVPHGIPLTDAPAWNPARIFE